MRRFAPLLLATALPAWAVAQEEAPLAEPPPPPPLPEELEALEPAVTIIQRPDATIEEYRIGGQLRFVRIVPVKGPPYYLIDTDGDGTLETRRHELDNPEVNQWILFRW